MYFTSREVEQMAFETGPFLKAAVFCDTVIEGKDSVLSLIRVVDRLTTTAVGVGAPKDMPPVGQRLAAVLMLTSGKARGRNELKLTMESPNGDRKVVWEGTVHFEGEDRGHNFVLNLQPTFSLEGLYWFDLTVEDVLMTRMAYRVIYTRQSAG